MPRPKSDQHTPQAEPCKRYLELLERLADALDCALDESPAVASGILVDALDDLNDVLRLERAA